MKDWDGYRRMLSEAHMRDVKSGRATRTEVLQVNQVIVLSHIAEQLQKLVELAERSEVQE